MPRLPLKFFSNPTKPWTCDPLPQPLEELGFWADVARPRFCTLLVSTFTKVDRSVVVGVGPEGLL